MVFFSHFFVCGRKRHRFGVFSHFFARANETGRFRYAELRQRNHAKTFFPGKKVLESKKGIGTATKLTFVGTGTDGKAV